MATGNRFQVSSLSCWPTNISGPNLGGCMAVKRHSNDVPQRRPALPVREIARNTTPSTTSLTHKHFNPVPFLFPERRYGCYRFGIVVAVIIIVILIAGTVPIVFAIDNSNVILIVIIVTLVVVGILLLIYCRWQQKQAAQMRQKTTVRELEYLGQTAWFVLGMSMCSWARPTEIRQLLGYTNPDMKMWVLHVPKCRLVYVWKEGRECNLLRAIDSTWDKVVRHRLRIKITCNFNQLHT